jgi:hypothetical protein
LLGPYAAQAYILGTADLSAGYNWGAAPQSFQISVNGAAPVTVTLNSATADADQVVAEINNELVAAGVTGVTAYRNPGVDPLAPHFVLLRTTGTGLVQSINLTAGAPDALATLGWAPGTHSTVQGTGSIAVPTIDLPPLETNLMAGDFVDFRVTVHIRTNVSSAQTKNLRLRLSDVNGIFETTGLACVPVDSTATTIQDPAHYLRSSITQIRTSAALAAYNYPNPFNPRTQTTKIVFSNTGGQVTIKIFTITGQLVRDLSNDPSLTPPAQGVSQVVWDGKNGKGQVVRNGVYVAIIKAGGAKMTVKIAVIK